MMHSLKSATPRRLALAATIAAALLAGSAQAASTPAIFTTNDFGFNVPWIDMTVGLSFTTNAAIVVDQLGIFDDAQDGLAQSHLLGLWDANGNLLGSTAIAAGTGAPLIDLHRYAKITPVMLAAGAEYHVGAYFADFTDRPAYLSNGTVMTDPRISLGTGVLNNKYGFSAPDFVIPRIDYAGFTIRDADAVPEPASWAMMLGGFALAGVAMRSRRSAAGGLTPAAA